MARYLTKEKGFRSAAIVKDVSSDYSEGLAESFGSVFESIGGQVVAEEGYSGGDTDFNAILTRLKGQQFDVMYIPGYYNEAGLIIKQARALGINATIVGADGFDSPTLQELAGADALNDVYFSNHYSSLDPDPKVQKFIADFKAKYGEEPGAFSALGYDTANFVADAVERAKTKDSSGIQQAMAATKDFPGVTGRFSIDKDHDAVKEITVIGLTNGRQSSAVKAK